MANKELIKTIQLRVVVKVKLTTRFSAICPFSKTRDDYIIIIEYEPNDKKPLYVELASLRKYLDAFKETEIYHESLADVIARDLYEKLRPKNLRVILKSIYLGIETEIEARK